jgi:ribosomal-protein-alanine N-acetyltransferase
MPFFEAVTLNTARLVLRPLREDDAAALFAMYSDPQFTRFWSFAPMTRLEQVNEYLSRLLAESVSGKTLMCALELRSTGQAIGTCTLFNLHEACLRAEIGFGVQRKFWGHGYTQEATSAFIEHAFGHLPLRRIEADIDPRNAASARVLERAGFVREGLLRERWIVGGEVSDSALYGLLRSDTRANAG